VNLKTDFNTVSENRIIYTLMSYIIIKPELPESVLCRIPVLRQVRRLLDIINETGGIKMTASGNLPVKIVQELYPLGVPDRFVEWGVSKVYREDRLEYVRIVRFLAKTCGAVRMYKGRLVLTKFGKALQKDPHALLQELLNIEIYCINNGGMDMYAIPNINPGIPDVLMLLYEYGSEPRETKFYAEEFAKVFPAIMEMGEEPRYCDASTYRSRCFSVRLIDRCLYMFGVAERIGGKYDQESKKCLPDTIVRKPLFDEVFEYVEDFPEELLSNDDDTVDSGTEFTLFSRSEAMALISALQGLGHSDNKRPLN